MDSVVKHVGHFKYWVIAWGIYDFEQRQNAVWLTQCTRESNVFILLSTSSWRWYTSLKDSTNTGKNMLILLRWEVIHIGANKEDPMEIIQQIKVMDDTNSEEMHF